MNTLRFTVTTSLLFGALAYAVPATAVPPPYAEDFEAEATCGTTCGNACVLQGAWTNATTDQLDWTVDVGTTVSGGTGPTNDHTTGTATGRFLYIETSGSCSGNAQEAHLISPQLELLGTTVPAVQFWYHMFGGDMGTMHVDVMDAAGTTVLATDVIPSFTDNVNAWQQTAPILLTAYVGQTIRIRIRGVVGNGFEGDMAIDDFSFSELGTPDVGVASVDAPSGISCGLPAAAPITVTVANYSAAAASNITVSYTINGGAAVTETLAGPIPGLGTQSYTFTQTADLSALGAYTIGASATIAQDGDTTNDAAVGTVTNARTITTFPALEDFEGATAAEWTAGGANSSWALGTPADTVISGPNSGANAWKTALNGNYNASEQSWVQHGACYDFTGVAAPTVQLAIFYESEFSWDGANVQYTTDGGANWTTLGALDDPINWYTDDSINGAPGGSQLGWTGRVNTNNGSGGWIVATHDATVVANQTNVQFRVAFGSDTSVQDEGFAFDDFSLFDNSVPSVEITQVGPPPSVGAAPVGATDFVTQELDFLAFGTGSRVITAVTVTNSGNIPDADIAAVRLHLDDGNGVFEPATDTLLGAGTFANGTATINTTGLSIATLTTERVFVSVDLAATALAGAFFGTDITNPAVDVVEMGGAPVSANVPLLGPLFGVAGTGFVPLGDDFSATSPARRVQVAPGVYPGATAAGTTVTSEPATTNAALVEIIPSNGTLTPVDGNGILAISFPNGRATGAVDYLVDLSAFDPAVDPIWLGFRFTDTGEEDDPEDNVFLSLDGGQTWFASLYNFTWTDPQNTWTEQLVDISSLVASVGETFTSSVVVRFQAQDDFDLSSDGLLIDAVLVGEAQRAVVERPIGTPIADDGMDMVGVVPPASGTLIYTISNTGNFPLVATATVVGPSNLTIDAITQDRTMLAGSSTATVQIDYTPGVGPFSFTLEVATDDPRDGDGVYTVLVDGSSAPPEADIDVQRPAGTSIASGGTDDVGAVPALVAQALTYTVFNGGSMPLGVTGVAIANEVNATATATNLMQTLNPFEGAAVTVDYNTTAPGPFSFDVTITSDDPDEATYTVTVSGEAVAPEIQVRRGGNDIANGDTDVQPRVDVGTPVTLDYVITNAGTANLTITDVQLVNLASVTASIALAPSSTVAAAGATDLGISYTLTAPGSFGFDIVITSDDSDEGTFTISVAGESTGPDIAVSGAAPIASGDTVDVGMQMIGEAGVSTFTVTNEGTSDLTLQAITIGAEMNVSTTVTQPAETTLTASASATFDVEFRPTAVGAFSFLVTVPSDDPDEAAFAFTVSGEGVDNTPPRDGGVAGRDGGSTTRDGGSTTVRDSGPRRIDDGDDDEGGCSCAATEPEGRTGTAGSAAMVLLIGAALVRRRRR